MVGEVDRHQLNTEKRLTSLEVDSKIIRSDINTIKNNHLAHIESNMGSLDRKIEKIDNRLWAVLFGIITLALTNIVVTIFN